MNNVDKSTRLLLKNRKYLLFRIKVKSMWKYLIRIDVMFMWINFFFCTVSLEFTSFIILTNALNCFLTACSYCVRKSFIHNHVSSGVISSSSKKKNTRFFLQEPDQLLFNVLICFVKTFVYIYVYTSGVPDFVGFE